MAAKKRLDRGFTKIDVGEDPVLPPSPPPFLNTDKLARELASNPSLLREHLKRRTIKNMLILEQMTDAEESSTAKTKMLDLHVKIAKLGLDATEHDAAHKAEKKVVEEDF